MRASLKSSVALSLAALTMAFAVSATPASAHPLQKFGGPHFPHFHHGWGWGPGVGLGLALAGGAVAAEYAYGSCIVYRPIYDGFGNYIGRRAVNVCY